MNEAIRRQLIITAASLWEGTGRAEVRGSEYLRGQVELIANSTGADRYVNSDDPRPEIENRILALI